MIRILNAEPINYAGEARQILRCLGEVDERAVNRSELLSRIADYDVLIVRLKFRIDREVIDTGKRLKVIATATTGLDHIDVDLAHQRGITVLSLQGESRFLRTIPATAEHTWALLLALVRRIPWAFQSVVEGRWNRDAFRGQELRGKRLGLVGFGRIGKQVARYGLTFEMSVAAYDPYCRDWPRDVQRYRRLDDLLSTSDVLSIHVPLNGKTAGLIGAGELAQLPPGALLINTSRGVVIDETALVNMLAQGHLAGAALDVVRDEWDEARRDQGSLLAYARGHRNLLITPHTGGATRESMERAEVFLAEKLRRWVQGHRQPDVRSAGRMSHRSSVIRRGKA